MKKSYFIYLGTFLISASVLIFEIILLKFFTLKLMGSWAFLVISMAFLGIGASGTYLYLKRRVLSPDINFPFLVKFSTFYLFSIPLSIIFFALLPLSPPQPGLLASGNLNYSAFFLSLLYVFIFAVPFFLSGVCVSYLLSLKEFHSGRILFCDLMGAGFGAVLASFLVGVLGGYGIVALSMVFAYGASLFFLITISDGSSFNKPRILLAHFLFFVLFVSGLLFYPRFMIENYHFDIVSPKSLEGEFKLFTEDFRGSEATYWSPIARIDLSREGVSNDGSFLAALSPKFRDQKYTGRYILVDSGCSTRQFRLSPDEKDNEFLGHFLFSVPYQLKENIDNVLIIGAGGGVEIEVAKYFKTKTVDVVEINPAIVAILKGQNKNDSLAGIYSVFTTSNQETTVNYYNEEGRSFLSRNKFPQYDILQLTGVDLLSALKSGALVHSENYLYTQEALEYYYDALKEGGYVQITYWNGPHALKLFVTALAMLEAKGIDQPTRSLAVVTDTLGWTNIIIKKGFFPDDEYRKIREVAERDGFAMLFDAEVQREFWEKIIQVRSGLAQNFYMEYGAETRGAYFLASVNESQFPEAANWKKLPLNLAPTHDDKPFFYSIYKSSGNWRVAGYAQASESRVTEHLIVLGSVFAFLLILLPLFLKNFASGRLKRISIPLEPLLFFGIVGVAFSLIEIVLLQKFSIFVGGPLYSMSVTLPTILIFYSLGAFCASKLKLSSFWLLILSTAGLVLLGLLGYFFFDDIIKFFFYLGQMGRIVVTAITVSPLGFFMGFPTPVVLELIKRKINEGLVPAMWGASSSGNVVGALLFASLAQLTGFNLLLLLSVLLYPLALILLILCRKLFNSGR